MIIKITKTITEQKEINFPYITFDNSIDTYYYNNLENSCIKISKRGVEIFSCNFGLEYPEAKQEDCFKLMDLTILSITEALNK